MERELSETESGLTNVRACVDQQIMMPFIQGILYNLAICGWQYWNRNAQLHGSSVGARLRRWWYTVNKWPIPPEKRVGLFR